MLSTLFRQQYANTGFLIVKNLHFHKYRCNFSFNRNKTEKWSVSDKMSDNIIKILFAGVFLTVVFCGCSSEEEKLFESAISKVDKGGTHLSYTNQQQLIPALASICKKAEVLFGTDSETRTLRGIVNALHIQNICATASSVKQDANGNYRLRGAMLLKNRINPSKRNIRYASRQAIPADAIFASGGKMNAFWCWMIFTRFAKASGNPEINAFCTTLPGLFQIKTGVPFADMLKSLDGEFLLTVCGPDINNAGAVLILPDKDKKIAQLLHKNLGGKIKNGTWTKSTPMTFASQSITPHIRILKNSVIISSSKEAFLNIRKKSATPRLLNMPEIQKLTSEIPDDGILYFFCKLDKVLPGSAGNEYSQTLLPSKPYMIFGNIRRDFDAYSAFAVTNAPVPKLMAAKTAAYMLFSQLMLQEIKTENMFGENVDE